MPQLTKNNYNNNYNKKNVHPLALIKFCVLFGMLLNVLQHPRAVKATDDVANVSPCELESIINQLVYPSPQYQMHAASLRNQLRNILRERQLEEGEEQSLNNDMDYLEEDKRSVAALAAQGLLHHSNNNNNAAAAAKRSLATLAKNGQLPTPDPEIIGDSEQRNEDKRYVGSLARSGNLMGYGKRNIGTLARDFQLPQNGKRNLATMARLGWLGNRNEPKRNLASVARYNSRMLNNAEKRNIGALKGSPVHGVQQKRGEDDVYLPAEYNNYMDPLAYYWNYATYADLDWDDYGRAQKRFLDTSKNPELFGIEHGHLWPNPDEEEGEEVAPLTVTHLPDEAGDSNNIDEDESVVGDDMLPEEAAGEQYPLPAKRHIGAVYRSGFLPSYRALRSTTGSGVGGGRFSRSGRARQFVEYYPQPERLRQPIAAVCKRCFLPYRPVVNWGATGIRGRWPKYVQTEEHSRSINTNYLPSYSAATPNILRHPAALNGPLHTWGTPPRITAMHRRSFRRNNANYHRY